MGDDGSRLLLQSLREELRLSAARVEPSAYAPGKRVQMYSWSKRALWRGYILEPLSTTPTDHRRIAWDDDFISSVPVTKLELIED